jgi:predicted PurR-regulated permease PerM
LLINKEKRYAQIMRFRRAFLSDKVNTFITTVCTTADRSFGGFLRGKILDSSIVGVLVYCLISLVGVPYAILLAVIVAITDIVPVIGPFIGVIPSAVIVLLTDPGKVIPFLLCILLVQQIDGNILAPKILGENTGISSLCVIIAISTMGSLFGLIGMIIGVPLMAVIYDLVRKFVYSDKRLRRRIWQEKERTQDTES